MKAKAVCVMRTDLRNSDGNKVPKGKLIAQGGHAFVGLITNLFHRYEFPVKSWGIYQLEVDIASPVDEWLNKSFTKVVLGVDSEQELIDLYHIALSEGLNVVKIVDNGQTEFGKPTLTCIGIGPDWEEKIDKVTGNLKGFQ
jgi:peptidyl-tRNA hydrolase, PTH2 family